MYKAVVCAVHTCIIVWAHPWLTFLYKASAAHVVTSTRISSGELSGDLLPHGATGTYVNGARTLNSEGEGSKTQRCPPFHCDPERMR